jgi:hypothetical protein
MDIHREWIESLLRNEPFRHRPDLERTRDLMDKAVRDCLVTGYKSLIPGLELPDPGDRHVLAAAIVGGCDVIVTHNLHDFPESILSQYGIEARHPDDFLWYHLDLAPSRFCEAAAKVRARLRNPAYSVDDYLETLRGLGLEATVEGLMPFRARL